MLRPTLVLEIAAATEYASSLDIRSQRASHTIDDDGCLTSCSVQDKLKSNLAARTP